MDWSAQPSSMDGCAWIPDTHSDSKVRSGFSGAGLWSFEYQAVVGLVGQAEMSGNGRAFTMQAIAGALPEAGIDSLADHWRVEDAGPDAVASWGWALTDDIEAGRHWRPEVAA